MLPETTCEKPCIFTGEYTAKLGHDLYRLHATIYNRVVSLGAIVLDSTGQELKCSESGKLIKTGRDQRLITPEKATPLI